MLGACMSGGRSASCRRSSRAPSAERLAAAVLIAFVLALSAACGGGGSKSASNGTPAANGTIGQTEPLPAGLQTVLADVAKVRELSPPPSPQVGLVSRSDLPKLLEQLLTPDDIRSFQNTTTLYRLLGHLSKDEDMQSVYEAFGSGSVIGLYSPSDKRLWVVHPDGQSVDFNNLPKDEKSTLAHELTHAIQDYHFHLDDVYKKTVDNIDQNLAWTCVIEGDAVTNQRLYTQQYAAVPFGRSGTVMLASLNATTTVPPSIQREFFFPYTTGADWISAIRQQQGLAPINAMLSNPPNGTAYVLHPELLSNGFKPAEVKLPDLAGTLGSGWKRESGGQFGEFGLRNYLQLRIRGLDASTAAAGWSGDHYDVYVDGGTSVAVFRVKFSDGSEAAQFGSAQSTFLKAAGAKHSTDGAVQLDETRDGNTTARLAINGDEAMFAIGSSKEIADKALKVLTGG